MSENDYTQQRLQDQIPREEHVQIIPVGERHPMFGENGSLKEHAGCRIGSNHRGWLFGFRLLLGVVVFLVLDRSLQSTRRQQLNLVFEGPQGGAPEQYECPALTDPLPNSLRQGFVESIVFRITAVRQHEHVEFI